MCELYLAKCSSLVLRYFNRWYPLPLITRFRCLDLDYQKGCLNQLKICKKGQKEDKSKFVTKSVGTVTGLEPRTT